MSAYDVTVVGAGPAGCAAALGLARAGRRVLVLDKARFPRDKCCGDGLTAAALRQLEALGLTPARVGSWLAVRSVRLRSPSGRVVEMELPAGGQHSATARRLELDAALVDLLNQEPGVHFLPGQGLEGLDVGPDRVEVLSSGGRHPAEFVVAADGAWSPTRRALRSSSEPEPWRRPGEWHAMRRYYSGTGPESRHLWVWFEPDLLPAYAWSFPLADGTVNFGMGIIHGYGPSPGDMSRLWEAVLSRPHIRSVLGPGSEPAGPAKAWPIPTTVDPTLLYGGGGRVLFTGDAARVGDPMTGEGIAQALESAGLAVAALRAGGTPAEVAGRYAKAVAAGLGRDNRLAASLVRALARPWGARAAVAAAGLNGWTRSNFARWMFESYPRAVLATPGRWHRRMFSPPGSFPAGGY